jgi:hypothetical protein
MNDKALEFSERLRAQYGNLTPPVTILLGFTYTIVRPAIMLASDSKITGDSSATSASGDTEKIVEVKFANGRALLAKAGRKAATDRFEEMFRERAAKKEITNARDPATVAEDAIRDLRLQLADRYPGPNLSQHLLEHECGFLLAYFFEKQPRIYSITLQSSLATLAKTGVATMGCAASLADFLLTGIDRDHGGSRRNKRTIMSGIVKAAVYTVELCKLHDSACGGQVQVGMINEAEADITPNVYLDDFPADLRSNHANYHKFLVASLASLKRR